MTERASGELLDQAITTVLSGNYAVRNSAMLAIRKYMQHSEQNAFKVCRMVEDMKDSDKEVEQLLYNMVRQELED